jgi:hypothetical protein
MTQLEELIDREEALIKKLLQDLAEVTEVNNDIYQMCRSDLQLRPLAAYSNRILRLLKGTRNAFASPIKYRLILRSIEEDERREKERRERREKEEKARKSRKEKRGK